MDLVRKMAFQRAVVKFGFSWSVEVEEEFWGGFSEVGVEEAEEEEMWGL